MTWLAPQRGAIPAPLATPVSRPYWEGIDRHELLFQRCDECRGTTHTPAMVCAQCGSRSMTWEPSSGHGQLYSWTTVFRPQTPEFAVPYAPVIVDVEEGWQMLSCLIGCDHEAAAVGLPVAVEFHTTGGGVTLPYFRPR